MGGMNLTKLATADYYLDGLADDLEQEDRAKGVDPVAYYARAGNPPGRWIGRGSEILGYKHDEVADKELVRSVINKSRDPRTGRILGDPDGMLSKKNANPVGGWDLTLTTPKSLSILWAFADPATRHRIEDCMRQARDMLLEHIETEGVATRAGARGVATVPCDGLIGFDFRHWTNRDGGPHIHDHIVISNRVRRSSDHQYTAIDGRLLYRNAVEYSELYDNLLMDITTKELGVNWIAKRNRRGTRAINYEIDGIDPMLIEQFSSRAVEINRKMDERVQIEEAAAGHPLGWRRKRQIQAEVWAETRAPKPDKPESLSELKTRWADEVRREHPGLDIERMIGDVLDRRHGDLLHVDEHIREQIGDVLLDQLIGSHARIPVNDHMTRVASDPEELAQAVIEDMENQRTTWTRSNVRAEAYRIASGFRVDPAQRPILVERITDHVLARCVKLTPTRYQLPQEAKDDPHLVSTAGRSAFDDPRLDLYTSRHVLDMEDRVMRSLDQKASCGFDAGQGRMELDRYRSNGGLLADDQYEAAAYALENPHAVSSIIGPAGTGKTTTMKAVTTAWKRKYGNDSVLGVALSNRAKDELANSIGGSAVTVAGLLMYNDPRHLREEEQERRELQRMIHSPSLFVGTGQRAWAARRLAWNLARRSNYTIRPGMMVIVDEAGMVGTRDLDMITRLALAAGARIVLTGDPMQLDTPSGAGGILAAIERKGPEYSRQLTSIWRFAGSTYRMNPGKFQARWAKEDPDKASRRQWVDEAAATLRLRKGGRRDDPASVEDCKELADEYMAHDRIHWGEDQQVLKDAYDTVKHWIDIGKSVVLIAGDNDQVRDLNRRFLLDRQANGQSDPDPGHRVRLSDDLEAGIGDQIICRVNDGKIRSDDRKTGVQNGMVMRITGFDGEHVRLADTESGRTWRLPYEYVHDSCEAGYAVTVHRAQGITVDRCYMVVRHDAAVPCNLQYVGGTRGREENHFGYACPPEGQRRDDRLIKGTTTDPKAYARGIFINALLNHPDNRTATETREDELKDRYEMKRLIAEHGTLGGIIARSHLIKALSRAHDPKTVRQVEKSPYLEWLSASWSRAFMAAPRQAMAILGRPITAHGRRDGNKDNGGGKDNGRSHDDPARILAARLDNGLLERRNGAVHDDWVAGVIPPVKSGRHDARWDMIQQNERLLEQQSRILEQKLKERNPQWLEEILPLAGRDANLVRDIAVYRVQWDILDDTTPIGPRPAGAGGMQRQQWVQIADRIGGNGPGVETPDPGMRNPYEEERVPLPEEEPTDIDYIDTGYPEDDGYVDETANGPIIDGKDNQWTRQPQRQPTSSDAQEAGSSI